jgi:hypothetical protein
MTDSMSKYVKALDGGMAMPANMLRENVQSMKKIEDGFETKTRKLHIAVLRKDPELMSEALDAIEAELAEARELLEKVKQL